MTFPLRHISIRVPWHDTGWDGRVCEKPHLNGSCLVLKRIGQERDDSAEELVAGNLISELPQEQWPCCVSERMAFMSPTEYTKLADHPYKYTSPDTHGHFGMTPLRHPSYSAPAVPFAWLLRDSLAALGESYKLDIQAEREPDLGFRTQWIQDRDNQKALLDCFRDHIRAGESLCFFYVKRAPFIEETGPRRILVGAGRVLSVSPSVEYEYTTNELNGKLRSMLWELMVQHSIRPEFKDGFILPYHNAIRLAEREIDFDPGSIAAFTPDDRLLEFSHASQLVTNDGAIASLQSCAEALRKAHGVVPGPWEHCLNWIDKEVNKLWKARGPFPGLGSALSAFGLEQGTFIAWSLIDKIGEDSDPWPCVDRMFTKPREVLPIELSQEIGETMQAKWKRLPSERRELLKLVSRFELSQEQAKLIYVQEERKAAKIDCTDDAIIENPYLLYEITRLTAEPISIWAIDRGMFPDETIRVAFPLPLPTALDAGTDARRIRALSVNALEKFADQGSTLAPQDQVVLSIRSLEINPGCEVDGDLLAVAKDQFLGAIVEKDLADGSPALQLKRFSEMDDVIKSAVERRIAGKRLIADADWQSLLNQYLDERDVGEPDELEEKARQEKAAVLAELAESRISVLIGPAGTGKTTLLSILCSHTLINSEEILLLAPTGKARVRMEQATQDLSLKGYTVAQFLSPDRYDKATGRYQLSDKPSEIGARTVIIDEASMLTEEMFAALIQAVKGAHRLILVGDHRQLPPIGSGRPFVDLVNRLAPGGIDERFPRVAKGYGELTIQRRQAGEEREDLRFAEWFSGSSIAPGEDDVFDKVVKTGDTSHIRFVKWDSPDSLRETLISVLVDELHLAGPEDVVKFDESLGGKDWNG